MKRLLDTSVLVAAMVAAHPAHARSVRFLERALAGRCESCVSTHSLAEIYAVLTRMPTSPRISPDVARRLVHDNLETGAARLVALDATDYLAVLDRMAQSGFAGGVIYDALIVQAACKAKADEIITLNEADFARLCSGLPIRISTP
ncbi:MAG: PIN domain-containing protein [Kiritimatiellia bacterium]|jgi:predicted nucleic acid-binding protein|nr:PIN domain-containing protein [Kiritimatiellia bacterium]MDD4172880.1 PIN domain-containing protein [Kiritimatiellia bacterium]MDD4441488.1 PIN domain-containing protein [Kiritimatiellia bacterium]MDX9792205.1 PIN domain-containing protein [Kiritimatiellia bacterium]NLC81063.1 type II toxin-antitoxin system VapC family toxin [Lentisphaerota bacterium]